MGILGTPRSLLTATLLLAVSSAASGQAPAPGPSLEIYGYVQADMGYDFNQIHPDWFRSRCREDDLPPAPFLGRAG